MVNGNTWFREQMAPYLNGLAPYLNIMLEYASLASFPVTGETKKLYVALDTKDIYRWTGLAYEELSASIPTTNSTDFYPVVETSIFNVVYNPNTVAVYVGGTKADPLTYTADNGTTVEFTNPIDAFTWVQVLDMDIAGAANGDMLKATYDALGNGIVDDSELVNGLTVETAVPVGALFTDTVYDDSAVLKDADTVSPVTGVNKLITQSDVAAAYIHPTHPGDDASIDTGPLTGATVISDLDFNVTTDTQGHVTDVNAAVATRALTPANIGAIPEGYTLVWTGYVQTAISVAAHISGKTEFKVMYVVDLDDGDYHTGIATSHKGWDLPTSINSVAGTPSGQPASFDVKNGGIATGAGSTYDHQDPFTSTTIQLRHTVFNLSIYPLNYHQLVSMTAIWVKD